jgi:hypothetical protein
LNFTLKEENEVPALKNLDFESGELNAQIINLEAAVAIEVESTDEIQIV